MPIAEIEINGVAGSDDDLPINTLVQLSNADIGGETTYSWTIIDQPEGTADTLSNSTIENPTFTPKKEGSYLIRLVVNQGSGTERSDTVVAAVRDLKTNERVPAASETVEVDTSKGWKPAANRILNLALKMARDSNLIACVAGDTDGVPGVGSVVKLVGAATLKSGLPGEEELLVAELMLGDGVAPYDPGPLGVVIGTPTGDAPAVDEVIIVRVLGLVEVAGSGSPSVGDPIYVDDTGQPSLSAGTAPRVIGKVVSVDGGDYRWSIGFGGGIGGTLTPDYIPYASTATTLTDTDIHRVTGKSGFLGWLTDSAFKFSKQIVAKSSGSPDPDAVAGVLADNINGSMTRLFHFGISPTFHDPAALLNEDMQLHSSLAIAIAQGAGAEIGGFIPNGGTGEHGGTIPHIAIWYNSGTDDLTFVSESAGSTEDFRVFTNAAGDDFVLETSQGALFARVSTGDLPGGLSGTHRWVPVLHNGAFVP